MQTRISVSSRQFLELSRADPMLIEVIREIAKGWPVSFLWITGAKRPGDRGVHGTDPLRGADARTFGTRPGALAALKQLAQPLAELHADRVNRVFTYDPDRPHLLVVVAKPHGTAPHLHIQVHPNTRRRT